MVSLEADEGASEVLGRGEGDVESRAWVSSYSGAEGSSGLVMLANGASFLRFCDEAVAK